MLPQKLIPVRDIGALLANLPGMVYRCRNNRDWAMEFASEGAMALTGYSPTHFTSGAPHWGSLIHRDDRDQVWARVQRALAGGRCFEIEYRIRKRDGSTRWVWERGCAVDSEFDELRLEGFISDVTLQKESQEALRSQHDQLTRASRLSLLGEMATGIAHEINQPLTAISTYAQSAIRFLAADKPKPDRLVVALEKLSAEARRAGAVVQRIRELAQDHTRDCELVDCNQLLQDVEALAASDARAHGIRLEMELADDLPPVWGDPIELQQVVLNLIRNAVDAMQSVGHGEAAVIRLRTRQPGAESVQVAVVDQGEGVCPEVAGELFAPFRTTKSNGLGLGLSISRSIATSHGGQLSFANNPSGGATFVLALPAAAGGCCG